MEMHTPIICLYLLLITHYATPKIYVVDLTDESQENDNIKLHKLLNLFKKTENRYENDKQNERVQDDFDNDCSSMTSKTERIECLEKNGAKSIGRESFYYPGLYHEFYSPRPKRTIYSLYNIYGGLHKTKPSFTDLTRQEFSQDYLDIAELSRNAQKCINSDCLQNIRSQDYKRKLKDSILKPKRRRQTSDVSDSSSDSEQDRKRKRPNRFQVVFNDDSVSAEREPLKSFSSESIELNNRESSASDSVEITERPVRREKYAYLQGNRLYDGFRRRLQHFLPKRFHWDNDDIHHLGYYWFNGPRGKYSK